MQTLFPNFLFDIFCQLPDMTELQNIVFSFDVTMIKWGEPVGDILIIAENSNFVIFGESSEAATYSYESTQLDMLFLVAKSVSMDFYCSYNLLTLGKLRFLESIESKIFLE